MNTFVSSHFAGVGAGDIGRTISNDSSIATSVVDSLTGSTVTQWRHAEAEVADSSGESLPDDVRELCDGVVQTSESCSVGDV